MLLCRISDPTVASDMLPRPIICCLSCVMWRVPLHAKTCLGSFVCWNFAFGWTVLCGTSTCLTTSQRNPGAGSSSPSFSRIATALQRCTGFCAEPRYLPLSTASAAAAVAQVLDDGTTRPLTDEELTEFEQQYPVRKLALSLRLASVPV